MRPIKLVMNAFGPYAGEAAVDFTKYEEKGLFLITGKTGSGKTTIFDGICYALFGKASGEFRGTGHMRSDYADETARTFVEFTFEHQGHTYMVRREPVQERKKKRGTGVITSPETVIFSRDGGVPAEGITGVNKKIIEVIGVNYNQFKQIAMIAQSEFYSLLNAGTDERTVILRSIFSTGGYDRISLILKEYMNESSASHENAKRSILQYLGDVQTDGECTDEAYGIWRERVSMLQEEASKSNEIRNAGKLVDAVEGLSESEKDIAAASGVKAMEADETCDEAGKKLAAAEENNRKIDRSERCAKEYAVLLAKEPEMRLKKNEYERRMNAVHEIKPVYDRYKAQFERMASAGGKVRRRGEQFLSAKENAKKAGEDLEAAKKDESAAEELEKEAALIAREKDDYETLGKLKEEAAALEKSREKYEAEEEKIRNVIDTLYTEISENEKIRKKLEDVPVKLSKNENKCSQMRNLRNKIHELVTDRLEEYRKSENNLREARAGLVRSSDAYDAAKTESDRAEKLFEFNQAGILAEALEEGKPCPVCGSVHHPDKAVLPDHSVTEAEVERKKKCAEDARNVREKRAAEASEANAAVKAGKKRLADDLAEALNEEAALNPHADTKNAGLSEPSRLKELVERAEIKEKELAGEISRTESLLLTLRKDNVRLREASGKLEQSRRARQDAEEKHNILSEELKNTETELSKRQGQLKSLSKLIYESWEAAERHMRILLSRAKSVRERISDEEKIKKAADEEAAAFEAALAESRENYRKEKEACDLAEDELRKVLTEHGYKSSGDVLYLFVSEDELKKEDEEIRKYDRDLSVAAAQAGQAAKEAGDSRRADTALLQKEYSGLREKARNLHVKQAEASARAAGNKKIAESIRSRMSEYEESGRKFNTARRLYRLAAGQTGAGKITFEQYMQAAGFDGIIRAANRRLAGMSGGQYELFRRSRSDIGDIGKKTNTFLDLEVLDHYTGKRRPVSTLSGGESFDASLSLALGLSDTISSNLGGIQIDALFVDEGFGTLDREMISRVLETLTSITYSNKLVGVISHREELAEAIPQQIIVEKDAGGSHIREVTGE